MHYSELIAKEEEIARLKAIIQGLSGNKYNISAFL